ncbi:MULTISPECIES: hypothetical protein [Planktothrix]|uniref:hypothetical protein n=1 Tax=Planktothrix TaxID=54304 RepID=UPI000416E05D|nr:MULTISPECIES: hypothetical protein [Planktothrix]CAD0229265.1 conserved hypothetical protein [Planktothrix agardhii]
MSCPQVGCKLRKTSENQAVCLKNGCVFRLEKKQSVDNGEWILWFLVIGLFVFIFVVVRG